MSSISPAAARVPVDRGPLRLSRLGDELLARQAGRGSERAFTTLYERYYQPLYRYCRSIVRDDADAQDALQSTFTSALAALQRDARNAPLRPWLYRIAHNESISLLRRRKRDTPQETVIDDTAAGASAEEEAVARARWQQVVGDLAELSERQRGTLLLRELAGLSHEEIALAFGTTVGAAKQAIFEARQGLAELEEGRGMDCTEARRRISEGDRRLLRGRRVNAHLRDCAGCAAFAAAIPSRQGDLRAMAPLPPATAAIVLSQVIRSAAPHGGASAGSAATASALGKATALVGWKALATVGVLAGTAAGVTGLAHVLHHARPAAAQSAAPAPAVSTGSGSASGNRSVTAYPAGTAKPSVARAHHRSLAASDATHHRAASHPGTAGHHPAQSSFSARGGQSATNAAPNSQAGDGHSHSAWGQVPNHGVRRHGSGSSAHGTGTQTHGPSQTHGSSQTHPTSHRQIKQSVTRTVHIKPSTSSLPHSHVGSPTGVANGHAAPTSTVTSSHPVTGGAGK